MSEMASLIVLIVGLVLAGFGAHCVAKGAFFKSLRGNGDAFFLMCLPTIALASAWVLFA